ncbi:TonB-dependent receptor domain-containing protein [uncultured Hymenobacter sp.]|uniref:TonB-dependent receptor n=1 Tax=uncultured Hymenobacter sp. TaxID=170016 RepID=UPI0035CB4077
MQIPRLLFQVALPLSCLGSGQAWAQTEGAAPTPTPVSTTAAAITGTTQTEQGAPLAGTSVVVLHLPTGIRRVTTADATGHFGIDLLLAGGPYVLQITQPTFRSQVVSNVFLKVGQPVNLSFTMVPDVVAVGTRRADRSAADAIAPVDVIDMRELALTAPRTDIGQILNYVVPSFNSTRQNAVDIADHMDPSSLRGLGVDQMLVLVNGKRFHSQAATYLLGTRGVGSSGTDVNVLSANALDRVEVLRDGAAAQYGSDAIAGVMNFTLKADNNGGNVLVNTGLHQAGDGLNTTLSLNKGLKLGAKGFLNLTGEADYRDRTSRNPSRNAESHPIFSFDPAEETSQMRGRDKEFEQINGDARSTNLRLVYNAGLQLSEKARFYSFGSYNHRIGNSKQPWIVGLATPNDVVPGLTSLLGYQPVQHNTVDDVSAALGLTTGLGKWSLDLSNVTGYNRMNIDLSESVNPQLGAASPTEFHTGTVSFLQNVSNATVSRLFDKVLAGTNVAFGAELRADVLTKGKGDLAGYTTGTQGPAGANAGAQGFLSFDSDLDANRQNYGAFVDVEADIVKNWTVGAALRYEKYTDFDQSAFTNKLNSRLRLAEWLAVRGGFNTGFRAPSIQQQYYSQTTVYYSPTGNINARLIPNQSEIRRQVGLDALTPETSRSFSGGLVLTPAPDLTLTADAYHIVVEDRILLSGLFGSDAFAANTGYANYLTTANAALGQFFANAADTRTRGLDLVARYSRSVGRGRLQLSLAANFNHTTATPKVPGRFERIQNDTDFRANYIDQRPLSMLETGSPASKIFAAAAFQMGAFTVQPRLTRFGEVAYYDYNFGLLEEGGYFLRFTPKYVTDLIVTYQPAKAVSFTLGANNLFNVLPDTKKQAAANGHIPYAAYKAGQSVAEFEQSFRANHGGALFMPYDFDTLPYEAVQMGFNGAFLYLKAAYSFGQ